MEQRIITEEAPSLQRISPLKYVRLSKGIIHMSPMYNGVNTVATGPQLFQTDLSFQPLYIMLTDSAVIRVLPYLETSFLPLSSERLEKNIRMLKWIPVLRSKCMG